MTLEVTPAPPYGHLTAAVTLLRAPIYPKVPIEGAWQDSLDKLVHMGHGRLVVLSPKLLAVQGQEVWHVRMDDLQRAYRMGSVGQVKGQGRGQAGSGQDSGNMG